MKWPCGWMYMWVQAARSCEWEVGAEWEEKSCFSETISTKARWKAVTLSWLLFCFLHLYKCSEVGDGRKELFYVSLPLSVYCVCVCVSSIMMFSVNFLKTHNVSAVVARKNRLNGLDRNDALCSKHGKMQPFQSAVQPFYLRCHVKYTLQHLINCFCEKTTTRMKNGCWKNEIES